MPQSPAIFNQVGPMVQRPNMMSLERADLNGLC
jgi:hypothetical protein